MNAEIEQPPVAGRRLTKGLTAVVAVASLAALVAFAYLVARMDGDAADGPARLVPIAIIEGPGEGARPAFDQPLGVAVAADGTVYVADTGNDRICAFSSKGRFLREWGTFGLTKPLPGSQKTWQPGMLNYPTGIDVGDDDLVYVADFQNDQICVFDLEGVFVRAFPDPDTVVGRGGSGKDGTGIAVTDVSVANGYVAATDTNQIFLFSSSGSFVRQFGMPGAGMLDLDHPNGVAFDGERVVVSDSNHLRLTSFDVFGKPEWSVGTADGSAPASGTVAFGLPRGVCAFPDGRLLVADAVDQSLAMLDANGALITRLGGRGTGEGEFNFPTDVDVLDDMVIVADKENNRVQILRLTGEGG